MAIVKNPNTLELDDIQGMIIHGYGKLLETAYILLKVTDPVKAKSWLAKVYPSITSAQKQEGLNKTSHLAFTANGLEALGMEDANLKSFPAPFREGMVSEYRSRILGDYGQNDPQNWRWGAKDKDLHISLILHTETKDQMTALIQEQKALLEAEGGIEVLKDLSSFLRSDHKEPFGFHDGISQPTIKGSGKPGPENNIVETGEFLLGYKNEHQRYPHSPLLEKSQGDQSLLFKDAAGSGKLDVGHNGSFLVFREMEQHVDAFWDSMAKKTLNADGSVNEKAKVKLASQCVGRWPSGASLVNHPDEDPGGSVDNDDFGYAEKDPHGEKCPFGSHMRRNNPRDSHREYSPEQSLKITKRHRIVRRGRNYLNPVVEGQQKAEEGLMFLCFNANIEMQFEFIQQTWSNNNQMSQTSNDVDIIIGVPALNDPFAAKTQFTIQKDVANESVDGWEQFVSIKGGEYFFFPSMSVIKYLATL